MPDTQAARQSFLGGFSQNFAICSEPCTWYPIHTVPKERHLARLVPMKRGLLGSVWVVSVAAVSMACSSDGVAPVGAAGSSAGGSSAGGGSAGGAHLPGQANLMLVVQPANQASCPVAGKTYVVGDPVGPNSVMPGDRLIDGQHGASITCSVHGSGPYTFSGSIRGTSSEADVVTVTISNGVVNQDKQTGTATLSVFTPQLASTFVSAAGSCTVSVIGDNVKSGSLWATVFCPSVADASTGQACAIGALSTFVLENCDGA
jgi:hypothetical protein